ncbi:MAG TPA: DUF1778 domain-containing protein [Verrucomicrobiae bacterium]|jgi:uncharacterized protein (DUF1778 family)|nr:DUF1778 domain-containing protein [Verrucomicrobiae bacterium]
MTAIAKAKTERLVARVNLHDKNLLERAAEVQGLSVARFVVARALADAERILNERHFIRLNQAESRRFVEALLAPPRPPTKALKKAMVQYAKQVTEA